MDEMECILEKAGRGVCLGSYDGGICRTGSGLFIPPAEVPPAVLIARRDLLKMKTGFTFLS